MKSRWFGLCLAAPLCAVVFACTGDDEILERDDAGFDAGPTPDAPTTPQNDASSSTGLGCGDAAGAPPRLLAVQGNPGTSELAAIDLASGAVAGRLSFASGYGVTSSLGADPYLLAQETDVVTRLDAREPWKVVSQWNVRGDDRTDGGLDNANPSAVVVPACGKGYVLRFNRNRIAVIDTTVATDAGAPSSFIDLAPLVQAEDADGIVEMTAAAYVPSKRRIFVLLGNVDLTRTVKPNPFETKLLCGPAKASIIAIDVDTDKVVSLGGTAPGGGIALEGKNPPLGSPFWYDAARDRFLVLHAGCNQELGDGGAGDTTARIVEEVDLATGKTKTLLDLNAEGFPSGMIFADATHAAISFYGPAYLWDPTKTTLGAPISDGLDVVAYDGRGNVVGTRGVYYPDGGVGPLQIVKAPLDAGPTVIAEDPFSAKGGYVSGVEVWPRP